MRIALLLRNIDERDGAGTYAQRIARTLVRGDPGNEYVLVFASEAARERHGHPAARNLVVEARSKLLWDQVAVPLALRRERVDVVLGAKHSIPLAPVRAARLRAARRRLDRLPRELPRGRPALPPGGAAALPAGAPRG